MRLQYVSADTSDISVIFSQAKNLIDTYEDISCIDYEKVLAWVKRKITENISQYTALLCDGEKCAFYRLCEDGELDDLYVLPKFQNKGIGTQILNKCVSDSNTSLYLYVFTRNVRAMAFYERFGFSVRESVGNTRCILALKG